MPIVIFPKLVRNLRKTRCADLPAILNLKKYSGKILSGLHEYSSYFQPKISDKVLGNIIEQLKDFPDPDISIDETGVLFTWRNDSDRIDIMLWTKIRWTSDLYGRKASGISTTRLPNIFIRRLRVLSEDISDKQATIQRSEG